MKIALNKEQAQVLIDYSGTVRTKRQKHALNQLAKHGNINDLLRYLRTFKGTSQYRVSVDKPKSWGVDSLANKGKNTVYNAFQKLLNYDDTHKPQTRKHFDYIGVEIECFIPFESLDVENHNRVECDYCNGRGIVSYEDEFGDECDTECNDCNGDGYVDLDDDDYSEKSEEEAHEALKSFCYNRKIKQICVKSDGSIRPTRNHFAVEITVLTRLSDMSNLKKLCDALKELKAKVNASCGLHVHLDCRNKNEEQVKEIGKTFRKALPVMAAMVPKSRRTNQFCQLKVCGIRGRDRYAAINLSAYRRHKTIEIRLHSGTTDFVKISNWVQLVHAISVSDIKKKCKDINMLTDYVNINQDLLEYMGQRTELFSIMPEVTTVVVLDNDSTDANPLTREDVREMREALGLLQEQTA